MLNALIEGSLKNRAAILLLTALLVVLGVRAALRLPLDAFPDTTPVQVQVNTPAPELAPEEVERLITFPVEYALGGLKGLEHVRSVSRFGLSQVVAIFSDDTDVYFARQQVNERLGEVRLPEGVGRPAMGPVATGLGEVYHYVLSSTDPTVSLSDLRSLQDWVIRPRLRRVPGVAEVNSWGGLSKQFEVQSDPLKLAKHGLTLDDLTLALRENNRNVGGGYVVRSGEASLIQGVGRARSVDEIAKIVVTARDGVPVRVKDVAEVAEGHEIRRGGVTAEGRGEVVLGLAFMRMGENSRDVTMALDRAMDEVRKSLPRGIQVSVVYERIDLVNKVLKTVEQNLLEGAVLVVAVLFAFLGSLRAGLIVASAIPLSMLFAVTMMERAGIAGSLMSLGAIDFGLVVDSSVVMVENCVRCLAHDRTGRDRLAVVRDAAVEVRKPTLFGEMIIMIVYLPVLTLQGVEGKLFRPMALTVVFALAGSMVLSLTLMPVLASLGLPCTVRDRETFVDRLAHWLFQPLLRLGLRFPVTTLVLVGVVTLVTTALGLNLGSEFVPRLGEGTVVINTVRLAGVSLEDSLHYGTHIERLLKMEFPDEVDRVWSRTGTAEVATDPMGFEVTDVFVTLKPRERWTRAKSQEELIAAMSRATQDLPGMRAVYSQPIEMRINEMVAGIRADLGVKVFGDDLEVLKAKAEEVERVLKRVPGAADVSTEQVTGQPVLRFEVDRDALARYGVSARIVLDAVQAAGGLAVGEVLEPERRFPLVVRLPESYRDDPRSLERVLIPTASGQRLPLTRLARVSSVTGPSTVQREWGQRRVVVQANVRGRDLGSFVKEAQERVGREVELPAGYYVEWGGQFENMLRAERRLAVVVPLALGLILTLLYLTFHSLRDALMIFSGVLFARVGGVLGLYVMSLPFTISAGVGFVALAGASMLEGLVLVSAIRDRMAHGMTKREAIEQARLARLRPVLMTGTVAALGFVPMMLSTGIGSEVQRPLATVVVFGMACDTFLTMLALPVLYLLFGKGPAVGAGERADDRGPVPGAVGGVPFQQPAVPVALVTGNTL
jgi:cobalt-zinc-cadmium resistance protein CzcA